MGKRENQELREKQIILTSYFENHITRHNQKYDNIIIIKTI